ncbi:SH3 domain-binding glutamic acid-rich protein homolog isoform X2 [Leptinotarsa decemlineata]|uniref:SH3 domain-binding glutamic acid-rich protein homolog isoform X2 n=1 Tax=Leptinotarsa decemlineata TaxID=7539 RepID=UPI003D30779A
MYMVKSRQQRVLSILDSKNIEYEVVDISGENSEGAREFMKNNSTSFGSTMSDPNPNHPLPPQIFNDGEYCGDYDMFDMANEAGNMKTFLKLCEDKENDKVSRVEMILKQIPLAE